MIVDFNINVTTIASIVVAVIALLSYTHNLRTGIRQMRENDLLHIDAKLDRMSDRIDGIYKIIAEKRG